MQNILNGVFILILVFVLLINYKSLSNFLNFFFYGLEKGINILQGK